MEPPMNERARITHEKVAEAAAALAGRRPTLPPMPLFDAVNFHATEARDRLADLWTLRDSLDAERSGPVHAVAVERLAELAQHYAAALDATRHLAADLGLPLDVDTCGPA